MVRILHLKRPIRVGRVLFLDALSPTFYTPGQGSGGKGMTPKEWSIEAFETCDHAGMICMNCAERAIKAAIEEEQARLLCQAHEPNGDEGLLREGVAKCLTSSA